MADYCRNPPRQDIISKRTSRALTYCVEKERISKPRCATPVHAFSAFQYRGTQCTLRSASSEDCDCHGRRYSSQVWHRNDGPVWTTNDDNFFTLTKRIRI